MCYLNELISKNYFDNDFEVGGIFDISNVAEYVYSFPKSHYSFFLDSICIIPPFKKTWFELVYPTWSYADKEPVRLPAGQSSGVLCEYVKQDDCFLVTFNFFHSYFKKFPSITDKIEWAGNFSLLADKFGKPVKVKNEKDECIMPGGLNKNLLEFYQGMAQYGGRKLASTDSSMGTEGSLIAALNFIHCKNIKSELNNYSRKIIRNGIRSGKPYFEKFYTLTIDNIKKKLKEEGRADEVGLKKAFHFCRGHFKTYTDEKPLFGKHTGSFWCPDHTKGDLEIGRIKKGYRLKV